MGEIADKSAIGELITKTVNENLLCEKEVFICKIGEFDLSLPASFNKIRPYLILQGSFRYTIDINTFGIGAVIKIENFMLSLAEVAKGVYANLSALEMQLKQAENTLDESGVLLEKIDQLKEKLSKIDEELGI